MGAGCENRWVGLMKAQANVSAIDVSEISISKLVNPSMGGAGAVIRSKKCGPEKWVCCANQDESCCGHKEIGFLSLNRHRFCESFSLCPVSWTDRTW